MTPAVPALFLVAPVALGSESSDWLELDREIASLARGGAPAADGGPSISYDTIVSFQSSNGEFYESGGEDLSGFELRRARLTFKGGVADTKYTYKIQGDLESGEMALKDAYVAWDCSESLHMTFGRYKNPLVWSGRVSSFADPFHDQPITGDENNGRSNGLMLEGRYGKFAALLSAQNGVDGTADSMLFVGRLQWDVVGGNAFGKWHGAYGYGEDLLISAAVSASDDGAIDDGGAFAQELGLVMNPFSLRIDGVQYADEYDQSTGLDLDDLLGTDKAGTSPNSVTAGYLFGGDAWEILARWESIGDDFETDRKSAGIVHYTTLGPNGRFALLYQSLQSDSDVLDGERFEISFALASS